MHKPENETNKILWGFDIQTDYLIPTRKLGPESMNNISHKPSKTNNLNMNVAFLFVPAWIHKRRSSLNFYTWYMQFLTDQTSASCLWWSATTGMYMCRRNIHRHVRVARGAKAIIIRNPPSDPSSNLTWNYERALTVHYFSHSLNTFGEGMNPTILSPATDKE